MPDSPIGSSSSSIKSILLKPSNKKSNTNLAGTSSSNIYNSSPVSSVKSSESKLSLNNPPLEDQLQQQSGGKLAGLFRKKNKTKKGPEGDGPRDDGKSKSYYSSGNDSKDRLDSRPSSSQRKGVEDGALMSDLEGEDGHMHKLLSHSNPIPPSENVAPSRRSTSPNGGFLENTHPPGEFIQNQRSKTVFEPTVLGGQTDNRIGAGTVLEIGSEVQLAEARDRNITDVNNTNRRYEYYSGRTNQKPGTKTPQVSPSRSKAKDTRARGSSLSNVTVPLGSSHPLAAGDSETGTQTQVGSTTFHVTPPTPTEQTLSGAFFPSTPTPIGKKLDSRRGRGGSMSTPSKLSHSMTAPLSPTIGGSGNSSSSTSGGKSVGLNNDVSVVTTITAGNENSKGGSIEAINPNGKAGGFFQSMFSAAQTAANTLSSTVANNIGNKSGNNTPNEVRSRSGTETDEADVKDSQDSGEKNDGADSAANVVIEANKPPAEPRKRLAVETLGMGELSLGSLGILPSPPKAQSQDTNPSSLLGSQEGTSAADGYTGSDGGEAVNNQVGQPSLRLETQTNGTFDVTGIEPLAPAVIAGGITPSSSTIPPSKTPIAEDSTFTMSPAYATGYISPSYENNTPGDAEERDEWVSHDDIKRSSSVRSTNRIGTGGLNASQGGRRHRNSSAASSLANHLQQSSTSPISSPASPPPPGPKITGFAVASKKRNRDFHALFKSVPEDDYLIEDYSCALQKEILLQGRLYVSEGHICFHSSIFGWVTALVISFDEVMAIEKKSTAMLFPNGIVIQTLHARNVFASFMSRDTTYDLLVNIWKISHPSLMPCINGFKVDNGAAGSKTTLAEKGACDSVGGKSVGSGESGDDEEYDEDEEYNNEDDGLGEESFVDARWEGQVPATSAAGNPSSVDGAVKSGLDGDAAANAPASGGGASGGTVQDFPGPVTHAPSDCGDSDQHYDRHIMDEMLPAPLGKIYSLIFGPQSYSFLCKFLGDQKVLELDIPNQGAWAPSPDNPNKKTRSYSYIRPLTGSIGPKQTKCLCTEEIQQMDLEKAVSVMVTTQTPDVPSGNCFMVRTRYCLTWGEGNPETRIVMNCTIEWTAKSWLKGPIEKGCNDGQITYGKDLIAALKSAIESSKAGAAKKGGGKGKGGKKRGGKGANGGLGDQTLKSGAATNSAAAAAREKAQREKEAADAAAWGPLIPLKPILSPVVDMIPGGGLGLLGIISVLLLILNFALGKWPFSTPKASYRFGEYQRNHYYHNPYHPSSQLWEELWHEQEAGLWNWLEERVGVSSQNFPLDESQRERREKAWEKLSSRERTKVEQTMENKGMSQRELEEALEVTQQKLDIIRRMVEQRKLKEMGSKSE